MDPSVRDLKKTDGSSAMVSTAVLITFLILVGFFVLIPMGFASKVGDADDWK